MATAAAPLWERLLPYIITGGVTATGAILGSRAAGRAADAQEAGAAEATALNREMFDYSRGVQEPYRRTGVAALGQLNRGMGLDVDLSGGPSVPGATVGQLSGTSGDLSGALLSADAAGNRNTVTRRSVGGAAAGAGTGALIGSVVPGIGTAIGAGIGATVGGLSGLIGKGRKEADQIVPYQNALTDQIKRIEAELDAKQSAGTLTEADWQNAISTVNTLKSQFFGLTNDFGRAGPQARDTIGGWVDPLLSTWGRREFRPIEGRMHGGPVKGTNDYIVGEAGPEVLRMERGAGTVIPLRGATVGNLRGMRGTGGPVYGADEERPLAPALNVHDNVAMPGQQLITMDNTTGNVIPNPSPGGTAAAGSNPNGIAEGEFLSRFNPSSEGYMPFNERFSFDPNQIYEDPGYQFRMNEGLKGVERRRSASGMINSGRTLKELTRYAQDYASGEFDRAYGRELGEFGLRYGQTGDAYNRFRTDQTDRFNRLALLSGYGQTAANQQGQYGANFGATAGDLAIAAANARAGGIAGQANIWNDALGTAGDLAQDYWIWGRN